MHPLVSFATQALRSGIDRDTPSAKFIHQFLDRSSLKTVFDLCGAVTSCKEGSRFETVHWFDLGALYVNGTRPPALLNHYFKNSTLKVYAAFHTEDYARFLRAGPRNICVCQGTVPAAPNQEVLVDAGPKLCPEVSTAKPISSLPLQ